MNKIATAALAAVLLASTTSAPAFAAPKQDTATPSPAECQAIQLAGYVVMGKSLLDENQKPRFTVSEYRAKFMKSTEKTLGDLADNEVAGTVGAAKVANDSAEKAFKCGLVKKDPPKKISTSSSELGNLLSGLLGIKLS